MAGTGTEVGKTWVTCHVASALRERGVAVEARKPAQSFDPDDPSPTDAELLAAATGEEPAAVCPPDRSYPLAMAPPMAAAALGRPPLAMAGLVEGLTWSEGTVVGFVESAGGVRSPLATDGDTVELACQLRPDRVVLVADAGLGTINAVRLSVAALGVLPTTVFLNHYDPADDLHRRNRDWLVEQDGLEVVCDPIELVAELRPINGFLQRERPGPAR